MSNLLPTACLPVVHHMHVYQMFCPTVFVGITVGELWSFIVILRDRSTAAIALSSTFGLLRHVRDCAQRKCRGGNSSEAEAACEAGPPDSCTFGDGRESGGKGSACLSQNDRSCSTA